MAEKRMFSKQIIDSDAFLDMPLSTQALYFHLSMRADDDGFVDNPKKIQRTIGASLDDLKLLLAKRYILAFESGVIVIKHWRIHNTIRSDRYKETVYIEEKALLDVKDNKAYTEKDRIDADFDELATKWQPNGNQMETQYRLDKSRLDKDRVDNNIYGQPDGRPSDKKSKPTEKTTEIPTENLESTEKPTEKSHERPAEYSNWNDRQKAEYDSSLPNSLKWDNYLLIYEKYPKKGKRQDGFTNYLKWMQPSGKKVNGKTYHLSNRQIYGAVCNYVRAQESKGTELTYYSNFDTLMNHIHNYLDGED